jgi:hypothetical protein
MERRLCSEQQHIDHARHDRRDDLSNPAVGG